MYVLVFYAVFANPFTGYLKIFTTITPVLNIFAPMHRSLIVIFVIVFLVGVLWIRGYLKSTRNMIISSLTISIVVIILGLHLNSRAVSDIERISQGEFLEIESNRIK